MAMAASASALRLTTNQEKLEEYVQLDAQVESDPICSSAGCVQYLHKRKDLGYDINYFVPNFGADQDINDTKVSLAAAEKIQGKMLDFPNDKWKKRKIIQYPVDEPYDEDVISTAKNLADAEKQLGHKWNFAE